MLFFLIYFGMPNHNSCHLCMGGEKEVNINVQEIPSQQSNSTAF